MEQRKLIKLGNSSFAIALPKVWVDKSGLKKGDNIFIEQNNNGRLVVSPSPTDKSTNKETIISVDNKDKDSLKKEIRAAYIKGYTSLLIKNIPDKQAKDTVKKILDEFLSFELIDSNEKEITAKDFFSLEDTTHISFIRRMDNNIREIFEIVMAELKKDKINSQKIREIDEIDKDINKFYFLVSRIFLRGIDNPSILTKLKTDSTKLFNDWWFSFNLESLADGLKNFLKSAQQVESQPMKTSLHELFLQIREAYIKVIESYYKEDAELALQTMGMTKKIAEGLKKIEKENSDACRLINDIDRIKRTIYQNAKMVSYMRI